jgi:uncharacterized membrane protein YkvI
MRRAIATATLYASILWLVVAALLGALRETLPDDESTAGAFLSGMVYAFLMFWGLLLFVTYLWWVGQGRP